MNIEKILNEIRSRYRTDADEEGETGGAGNRGRTSKKAGGHGNTRLPYGLAKAEGINTEGMTPKEVWEALLGEGYSPSVVYKRLKEGKHGKELKGNISTKTKVIEKAWGNIKPVVSKLSTSVMPESFSASKMKTTVKSYIDTINNTCKDEDAMRFLLMGNKTDYNVSIIKKKSQGACLSTWKSKLTGEITRMELEIPEISKNDQKMILLK